MKKMEGKWKIIPCKEKADWEKIEKRLETKKPKKREIDSYMDEGPCWHLLEEIQKLILQHTEYDKMVKNKNSLTILAELPNVPNSWFLGKEKYPISLKIQITRISRHSITKGEIISN